MQRLKRKNLSLEKENLKADLEYKNKELTTNVMYLLKKNEFIINISDKLKKTKYNFKPENRVIIDSDTLAKEAGSPKTQNMVMLGAASRHLILEETNLLEFIRVLFDPRGEKMVTMNLRAFALGKTGAAAD